jgi:hypothetical protein
MFVSCSAINLNVKSKEMIRKLAFASARKVAASVSCKATHDKAPIKFRQPYVNI